jgi:hypothetical protein
MCFTIATISGRSTQTPPTPLVELDTISKFSFPARGYSTHAAPISPGGVPRYARSQSVSKASEISPALAATSGPLDLERKSPRWIRNLKVDAGDTSQLNKGDPQIDPRGPIDEPEYEQIASARVIPAQSVGGDTPRSSGEFYSMSNSTTETLLSEYDPKASSRLIRSAHNRRHSLLSIGPKLSESLMMGYAQVTGSFTLDGSLVQTSIFEEVKRKGVVGTQSGGGVVGIETSKTDGGFLSGFGWGLGGGLGGLLGGSSMSSIAQMKNIASKSPLASYLVYILTITKVPSLYQYFLHRSRSSLSICDCLRERAELMCTSSLFPGASRHRIGARRLKSHTMSYWELRDLGKA